ncbi:MAG: metal-dependent transcriptional regulator [Actinomycetota bacterium]|nr:metal-dependent transcriptional regulator [Actinomycetota bacterium]
MKSKQTARMEDYLEAIYELQKEEGVARVSSIGRRLQVTMPTVNSAINRLSEKKLVKHDRYGDVELTREGLEIGREVSRRHRVLTLFLSRILGVDEETSRRDACEIEHSLSPKTADRLTSLVEFILDAPRQPEWLRNFDYYYRHGKRPRKCYERFDEEEG